MPTSLIVNNIFGQFSKAKNKKKKLRVMFNYKGRIRQLEFGASGYEHYKDKTKIWKSKDHNDNFRRQAWRKRMSKIKYKNTIAYKNPLSPLFWAWRVLW